LIGDIVVWYLVAFFIVTVYRDRAHKASGEKRFPLPPH